MTDEPSTVALSGRLHHAIVDRLIVSGRAPSLAELARLVDEGEPRVREGLTALEAEHGVVLDPGTHDVWVVHPFSTTPTLYWVERGDLGWWAPCAWCAFGIASLVGDCDVTTRVAGNRDLRRIEVREEKPRPADLFVHFPLPIRRAWKNVHRFCASTLVFDRASDVAAWCDRHGMPVGSIQPVERVAALGHAWYAGHRAAAWRKHSTEDAKRIFDSVGLVDAFWSVEVEAKAGRF